MDNFEALISVEHVPPVTCRALEVSTGRIVDEQTATVTTLAESELFSRATAALDLREGIGKLAPQMVDANGALLATFPPCDGGGWSPAIEGLRNSLPDIALAQATGRRFTIVDDHIVFLE